MTMQVARVALPIPRPLLFDYLPGARDLDSNWIGCRVRVPFGQRSLVGVVAEVGNAQSEAERLRPISERIDESAIFRGEHLQSLRWLADYYQAPLGEVFALALPGPLRQGEPLRPAARFGWQITSEPARLRAGGPARLYAVIGEQGGLSECDLDAQMSGWRRAARALRQRGLLQRVVWHCPPQEPAPTALNAAQAAAAAAVHARHGQFAAFVLDGVTGSGKTEVYLELLRACVLAGEQALVLVPEIGLTPQTLRRFKAGLGAAVVALHSEISDNERSEIWAALAYSEPLIVVGTRSASLAPLPRGGLIVVDEEHDTSYKQQDGIRYSARDFALVRGRRLGIPVVLGSATPALESLARVRNGRYTVLKLPDRAIGAPPDVEVVDLRRQRLMDGLSATLLAAVDQTLTAGGQVLLFRNRRGYAPALVCHDCGWTACCRRCDRAFTVHRSLGRLRCHHCGAEQLPPAACPDCAGRALNPQGIGTERIAHAAQQLFPAVQVLRIDRETTNRRRALSALLEALGDRPGILVGTQMLAKGHDLPKLNLVAVVDADSGLFSADFRAGERLAQLLIQVSGRAGRRERRGRVLLQTHHPDHPLLIALLNGGYGAFAQMALAERTAAGLPPFTHLAVLRAESPHAGCAEAFLKLARSGWLQTVSAADCQCSGPWPAPMPRRAGRERWQMLLASPRRTSLQVGLKSVVLKLYSEPSARKVRWSVDVDPVDLY